MSGFRSITPGITVNTGSSQLRTELLNTFSRLDGQLQAAPYRLSTQNGPVGNTAGIETTLMTFQLNFNTLTNIGQSLLIYACGTFAANANNKTFSVKLGATTIFTTGAIAANNTDWVFNGEIISNGATAQIAWGTFTRNGVASIVDTALATENLGTNLDINFTGTGVANDDISMYYYKAVLLN